jgi:hypothetical protein
VGCGRAVAVSAASAAPLSIPTSGTARLLQTARPICGKGGLLLVIWQPFLVALVAFGVTAARTVNFSGSAEALPSKPSIIGRIEFANHDMTPERFTQLWRWTRATWARARLHPFLRSHTPAAGLGSHREGPRKTPPLSSP